MNRQFRDAVVRAAFKPLEANSSIESTLKAKLGLPNRNDAAQLCIGRSLAESSSPQPLSSDVTYGKSIDGAQLFGDDIDLWLCALLIDGELGECASIEDLRALVEAHWARGAKLLKDELVECGEDDTRLLSRLAELLPAEPARGRFPSEYPKRGLTELRLQVGSVSQTFPDGDCVDFVLNGQGTSPHIALMGKIGSGKTTTGIQIALQMLEKANIPLLFIDPKGEFLKNGKLDGRFASVVPDAIGIEVGKVPIPLDFLPDPSVGRVSVANAAMTLRDSIALCCKGAGDIQKDLLRTAIEKAIRGQQKRDLTRIRDLYRAELSASGKKPDSIVGRLNEMTGLHCFAPEQSMGEFFSKSWVLSLGALASEEVKKLIMLLVLDALKAHVMTQQDSETVDGFRILRHLLVVDEARRILAERRYQSLVDLVRQGRSKGSVVMLLSQDPSDFEGQADDFTTQLGTVIAFACSQTQHGLRALQGVYGRKVQSNEFSDTWLPPGVAFVKLPGRDPERVSCWMPTLAGVDTKLAGL